MTERVTSDAALLEAAADGDLDAFEALVREHTATVYAHALRFFGDRTVAEDVTQEVWIKVYRSLATFDGRARFSTWLYRITRNTCLDTVRAGKHRPVAVELFDTVATPGDLADEVALSSSVEAAMANLQLEDREAFSAVALFGLTYVEAAEQLGVPAGTVKSRVFRARRALAHALGMTAGGA
ncbi:MAG: sigma-70 family RNA polymerase sigma factor [Coriobacteriia bacterium]|nr:sigma-70 family RNA polymerase sigma factor [Coriobacteriia bacterium]